MVLYLKITRDKYELPVAVADTPSELARMVGVNRSAVTHSLHKTWKRPTYVVVEIDDTED